MSWAILASTSACRPISPSPLSTAEPAEPAQLDGELRRHQGVGRVGQHRDLEPVGVELPRRRHVLRRAGAPRRHDVDVVEFVGATGGAAHADLNHVGSPSAGVVVGRFDGHGDVVRVAFLEARRGDPDELRLLQRLDAWASRCNPSRRAGRRSAGGSPSPAGRGTAPGLRCPRAPACPRRARRPRSSGPWSRTCPASAARPCMAPSDPMPR